MNKKPKILPMKEKCNICGNPMGNSLNKVNGISVHKHCEINTPSPEKYECECGEEVKANGEHICSEKWAL